MIPFFHNYKGVALFGGSYLHIFVKCVKYIDGLSQLSTLFLPSPSLSHSLSLSLLHIYQSFYISIYISTYRPIDLSVCPSIYLSIYLSIFLSFYLSIFLSFYLSIFLSFYLSIFLSLSIHPSFLASPFFSSNYNLIFSAFPSPILHHLFHQQEMRA